jgi:hypothetical protein
VHADGESLLRPLRLSEREAEDLVAFLESLTAPGAAVPPAPPAAIPGCAD